MLSGVKNGHVISVRPCIRFDDRHNTTAQRRQCVCARLCVVYVPDFPETAEPDCTCVHQQPQWLEA